MDRFFIRTLLAGAFGAAVLALSSAAAEFRVDNRVFAGVKKEPVSVSLTLFHEAMVYDFLQKPAETTVFDPAAGRFYLLDSAHRRKTEISAQQIASYLKKVQQRAEKHADPIVRFTAAPQFDERFDRDQDILTLSSPAMTYRIMVSEAESPVQAAAYREFADASARLNAVLDSRGKLPFPRLKVNEVLARRGLLPREVTLTVTTQKKDSPHTEKFRSEHRFSGKLSDSDRKRIAQAREAMKQYQAVDFTKYGTSEP
jgi:hypothetical protein